MRESGTVPADTAYKPMVLYRASIERMDAAQHARWRGNVQHGRERCDYVVAMYLAGLAVECVLQAIALLDNPKHDERHDLKRWLSRCPTSLQDAVRSQNARAHWNTVVVVWKNNLRYLSEAGLLGYLRGIERDRGISGGPEAILKMNADRLLESASVVQKKGIVAWDRYTKR